jgi:hypothetical protein
MDINSHLRAEYPVPARSIVSMTPSLTDPHAGSDCTPNPTSQSKEWSSSPTGSIYHDAMSTSASPRLMCPDLTGTDSNTPSCSKNGITECVRTTASEHCSSPPGELTPPHLTLAVGLHVSEADCPCGACHCTHIGTPANGGAMGRVLPLQCTPATCDKTPNQLFQTSSFLLDPGAMPVFEHHGYSRVSQATGNCSCSCSKGNCSQGAQTSGVKVDTHSYTPSAHDVDAVIGGTCVNFWASGLASQEAVQGDCASQQQAPVVPMPLERSPETEGPEGQAARSSAKVHIQNGREFVCQKQSPQFVRTSAPQVPQPGGRASSAQPPSAFLHNTPNTAAFKFSASQPSNQKPPFQFSALPTSPGRVQLFKPLPRGTSKLPVDLLELPGQFSHVPPHLQYSVALPGLLLCNTLLHSHRTQANFVSTSLSAAASPACPPEAGTAQAQASEHNSMCVDVATGDRQGSGGAFGGEKENVDHLPSDSLVADVPEVQQLAPGEQATQADVERAADKQNSKTLERHVLSVRKRKMAKSP